MDVCDLGYKLLSGFEGDHRLAEVAIINGCVVFNSGAMGVTGLVPNIDKLFSCGNCIDVNEGPAKKVKTLQLM